MMRKWLYRMMLFGYWPILCIEDPPAGDPPAGDPPAGDPPAGDPPAGDPPAGDPPTDPLNLGDGDGDPVDYSAIELGEEVKLDAELVASYGEQLNGAKITGEQFKALAPIVSDITTKIEERQAKAYEDYQNTQIESIQKMSEEEMGHAKQAAEKFAEGDEEALNALRSHEANRAWLIRVLSRVGKAMQDDAFIEGQGGAGASKPAEQVLFPSMNK